MKKTNLKKYGYQYASQHNKVKEKRIATTIERFGVENISQNKEIHAKIIKTQKANSIHKRIKKIEKKSL